MSCRINIRVPLICKIKLISGIFNTSMGKRSPVFHFANSKALLFPSSTYANRSYQHNPLPHGHPNSLSILPTASNPSRVCTPLPSIPSINHPTFRKRLAPSGFCRPKVFPPSETPKLALISRNSYVTPPFFLSIPTTLLSSPKFPPLFPLHSSTTASPSSNRAQSRRPPSALPIPRPTTPALRVAIFLFFHREHAIALFLVDATGSDAGRGDSSVKAAVGAVACGCGDGAEGIVAAIDVFGIGGIRTRRKAGAG